VISSSRLLSTVSLGAVIALVSAGCASSATTQPSWTYAPVGTATTTAPTTAPTSASTAAAVASFEAPKITWTPGTVANPRVIEITADDGLNFTPGFVEVAKGETVTFRVTDTGKADHEFMVGPAADALGDVEGTPEIDPVGAGTSESISFTFDKPGVYAFACHAPGHFEHGMIGWISVIDPSAPTVGTKEAPRLVHVDMTDRLAFSPGAIQARSGETIRFVLTNSGKVTHEFAVGPAAKVNADQVDGVTVLEADEIVAGMTKTVDYTFDGPGPYGFACHEPGHFEAGMTGTVALVQ
jgi:uncharacterized cupredoxin-like copper-binding protein